MCVTFIFIFAQGNYNPDHVSGIIDWASCDFLGLAEHPDLNKAEGTYIVKHGNITFNRYQNKTMYILLHMTPICLGNKCFNRA